MKTEPQKTTSKIRKIFVGTLLLFVVCGGAVVGLLKLADRGQTQTQLLNQVKVLKAQVESLENKMVTMEKESKEVQFKEIAVLQRKVDDFKKGIDESLSSKAEEQEFLNLSYQFSELEKNMKASSSKNALILTAAGLVENAASGEKPFVYEASVLKGLCEGTEFEGSAGEISEIAVQGVSSEKELIRKFKEIYESALQTPQKEIRLEPVISFREDWKAFLKNKVKNLVSIEKIKKQNQETVTPEEEVLKLVEDGKFDEAILKMEPLTFFQTENFEIWKESEHRKNQFENVMEKIKANMLGALKTEILKK